MELNLKILALLLQCTSIFRCALFMKAKKKKKKFYSSYRLKNHFFLSLSLRASVSLPNHSALIHSPKSLSVCASLSLANHSSSHKSPIIKLTSSWPSCPKAPNHSPSLLSHRHAISLSSLTPLLTRFDCEIGLTGFDCFMVVLWWVFVVVLRWVFVVMRSNLWASGATVLWFVVGRRPLWICGGVTVL